MRHLTLLATLAVVLALVGSGCSLEEGPLEAVYSESAPVVSTGLITQSNVVTSNLLNGYLVEFDGRSFSGTQTTFSYTVTGAGAIHALSNFFLEIPDCAPALDAFSPAGGSVGLNPLVNIFGIKWSTSLGTNESRSYSITFPGDVPLGVILTSVKAGTESPLGEIAGPCSGFLISGTVYVDADSSGSQIGPDETGIQNVTVSLTDGGGFVMSSVSDANGDYSFLRVAGSYTLSVDSMTTSVDFNEELIANFVPTGATSASVTIGPDSPDNDFGYDPNTEEIIIDLETGVLLTNGEDPKFWRKQLRGKGNVEFDHATMVLFITQIQGLFLSEPFQFTPGDEFREAGVILGSRSKDPVDELIKQLLAAEFNHVSGKGLVNNLELQTVLLAWVESVIVQSQTEPPAAAIKGFEGPARIAPRTSIDEATDLLNLLNGVTGGGGSGGGG